MTQSVQRHAAAERHPRGDILVPIGDVVARLQHTYPEISHSSLRFLEREGLIEPRRTAGGHRLYTPADIERIAQIKTWQAQRLSLVEIRKRLAARSDLTEPASLANRFLEAVLAGIPDASAVVLEADDLGMPLIQIFEDVLRPALRDVGQRWAHGELRVGQEHEVTEVARDLIAELTARHAQWEGTDRPILAACVAGEHHDLGLRMVIALLRARGQGVQYLGADVSARFLVEEVSARGCDIVLLSATMDARLPATKATVEALRAVDSSPPRTILIGGETARRHRDDIANWGVTPIIDDDLEGTLRTILSARDERVRHALLG